jgi:hypothetical protein
MTALTKAVRELHVELTMLSGYGYAGLCGKKRVADLRLAYVNK